MIIWIQFLQPAVHCLETSEIHSSFSLNCANTVFFLLLQKIEFLTLFIFKLYSKRQCVPSQHPYILVLSKCQRHLDVFYLASRAVSNLNL